MVHGKATSAFTVLLRVFPLYVDTRKFLSLPVLGDFMVLFEYAGEMFCVLLANVLYAEVIHD